MKYLFVFLSVVLSAQFVSAQADDWGLKKRPVVVDSYAISPLNKYLSRKEFNSLSTLSFQGEAITIDTDNTMACLRVREALIKRAGLSEESLKNLCSKQGGRYVSIVRMEPVDPNGERVLRIEFTEAPSMSDQLGKIGFLGVGVMGTLALAPQELTNWEDDPFANALDKWRNNVSTPPVVDKDNWAVNYIGHPVSGAAYYIIARQTGLDMIPSFGFSVVMSTFFWEYGLEAVAEKPSIQDLILTPTIGALLGEAMYRGHNTILANGGTLWGSKTAGQAGLIITDPVGSLVKGLNKLGNNDYLSDGRLRWGTVTYEGPNQTLYAAPGAIIEVRFGR